MKNQSAKKKQTKTISTSESDEFTYYISDLAGLFYAKVKPNLL